MIRKVEMERFTVISARPFDEVVAAIKTSIGNPNVDEFWKSTQEAKSAAELDNRNPACLESSHHERNGEACFGRRIVCSGYRPVDERGGFRHTERSTSTAP